jgi:hypothetical protein
MSLATTVPTAPPIPTDQDTRPKRARRSQATRNPGKQTPKSRDAGMVKASFYLTAETAKLLAVASTITGEHQSDIVEKALRQNMPSIEGRLRKLLEGRGKSDDQASTVEGIDQG